MVEASSRLVALGRGGQLGGEEGGEEWAGTRHNIGKEGDVGQMPLQRFLMDFVILDWGGGRGLLLLAQGGGFGPGTYDPE